jgi:pyruvate kinase
MPIRTAARPLQTRRTKIVATLGPASAGPGVLEGLIRAGTSVFRLNLSHGDHESHREVFRRAREAAAALGRPVGILADLPGPKIRAGVFSGGSVLLSQGEEVTVTTRDVPGGPALIASQYEALARDVSSGDRILLDDGALELEVLATADSEVRCRVVTGGVLRDRKGMNLPGVKVSAPALTERDRRDARFALELGVDFLALSFVRRGSDMDALRRLRDEVGSAALLVAKIEKREALDGIEEILDAADGIMVARGDLGVELLPEKVPIAQGQLVEMARSREKPVIVATQMLESMIHHPRPTRAEVMDVSQAVQTGADAVMLSGETSSGDYPVQAVEMMDRVIRETEAYLWERGRFERFAPEDCTRVPPLSLEDAVARATAQLSRDLLVRAIVVFTRSGWTAGKVSAGRPQAPILSAMNDPDARRRTTLFWGVDPVAVDTLDPGPAHEATRALVRQQGVASDGDYVLEVRGFQWDPALNFPTISVCRV